MVDSVENIYKVKLVSVWNTQSRVTFEVTPTVTESGTVEYAPVTPVHMPGSIQVYKFTNSRTFSITARLISRTSQEASENKTRLQTLRSWRMPFFGIGSSTLTTQQVSNRAESAQLKQKLQQDQKPTANQTDSNSDLKTRINQLDAQSGNEMLGAPPEVLYFYGYSSTNEDGRTGGIPNLNRIPVVITSLDITYPEDVDYIPSMDDLIPFPTRMEVSVTLLETHSPVEYAKFSLQQYKAGKLPNF